MNKEETRERLLENCWGHDCQVEPDPYFEDEDVKNPHYDGCLIVNCWNCLWQDHFMYNEESNSAFGDMEK